MNQKEREKKVNDEIIAVRKYLEKGEHGSAYISLDRAKLYARRGRINASEEIKKVEKEVYTESVERRLTEAMMYAKKGDASFMETLLELGIKYAKKAGFDVSDRVKDIKNIGYETAFKTEIIYIEKRLDKNDYKFAIDSLKLVKVYAKKGGIDADIKIKEIRKEIYKNAVKAEITAAKNNLNSSGYGLADASLNLAELYAKRGRINASKGIKEVRKEVREIAVESEITATKKYLDGNDYNSAKVSLNLAIMYVGKIDKNREIDENSSKKLEEQKKIIKKLEEELRKEMEKTKATPL